MKLLNLYFECGPIGANSIWLAGFVMANNEARRIIWTSRINQRTGITAMAANPVTTRIGSRTRAIVESCFSHQTLGNEYLEDEYKEIDGGVQVRHDAGQPVGRLAKISQNLELNVVEDRSGKRPKYHERAKASQQWIAHRKRRAFDYASAHRLGSPNILPRRQLDQVDGRSSGDHEQRSGNQEQVGKANMRNDLARESRSGNCAQTAPAASDPKSRFACSPS